MALRTLISRSSSLVSLSPLFSSRTIASKSISLTLLTCPAPLLRIRPLVSLAETRWFTAELSCGGGLRCFSTRPTTSSLNDPSPNWSNRPPKETILLDGCDFEHWLVVMEPPEGEPTRDEIIDSYIKTLAQIVGSEEEARKKIYSVSTRHYFAFGALVSEELSYKIKSLARVRWVLPDSYLDVKNKDYGGEPFIDGQAVPYDPKYHEEWVRNNARANERSRRNDRPRNFDRSRNFERRRENMQNRDFQNRDVPPMPNQGFQNRDGQNPMPPRNMPPMPNQGFQDRDGQNPMPPRNMPPMPNQGFQNREGQNPMPPIPNRDFQNHDGQTVMPPRNIPNVGGMPNRDVPPSPQYSNRDGAIPNPSFQSRDGPNREFGGAPSSGYQNHGPNYQTNYMPNRDGGNMPAGNAYQGGTSGLPGSGNPYQGGGSGYPGSGNPYQGGGSGYPGTGTPYQGGGGTYQGRDLPGRDQ